MQPYFFPYIGYFQLIAQADIFVLFDDVQYINRGWINRNRILWDGAARWVTLPVIGAAHDLPINQRIYQLTPANIRRTLRVIEATYRKACRFEEIFPLICKIMSYEDANVAAFNANLIGQLCAYLRIGTQRIISSELTKNNYLTAEERVIDICDQLKAAHYVNPEGGKSLYRAERFAAAGIKLSFLESSPRTYQQFKAAPVSSLSIIDVLMFNGNQKVLAMLQDYRLIAAGFQSD